MASITITYPTGDGVRFAAALGKALHLTNGGGSPRSATAAECKTWLINAAQQLIVDIEGGEAKSAALAAISVTPLDMT